MQRCRAGGVVSVVCSEERAEFPFAGAGQGHKHHRVSLFCAVVS